MMNQLLVVDLIKRNIGTISNEDGEFVLNLQDNHTGDTLVFSYMGYENRFIPVEQFSDGQIVKLDEKLYSIQEVIVRTFDADDFDVSFEMVTSSLDTSRVKSFEQGTFAKPHKVFIEQIENYDPDFWGNYNYIKPDEPLEQVVRKLGSKIDILE